MVWPQWPRKNNNIFQRTSHRDHKTNVLTKNECKVYTFGEVGEIPQFLA